MDKTLETIDILVDQDVFPLLISDDDSKLRYLESHFKSRLTIRGNRISAQCIGSEGDRIKRVFDDVISMYKNHRDVTLSDLDTILRLEGFKENSSTGESGEESIVFDVQSGQIVPRGARQVRYVKLMEKNPIVFAAGPAGTGKTYLAVAMAVNLFLRKMVDRIVLVRPVVESGEHLGFLPGDILEKVDPYFRPLYDALDDMLSIEKVRRYIEKGMIEIAPLAYMRGRTLNRAFVILDEAQNTTSGQMKMFLTRIGNSSRAVLTGDLSQIDLPEDKASGLDEAWSILQDIRGIGFVEFRNMDVVRHRLVAEIIKAYDAQT